ncbi:MAG: sensor histidine kinase regulating citrate/malate metabolism [Flavobacteriales bacterium]|jgi:sensor histidine kinase regulating citrate/malate metabolism
MIEKNSVQTMTHDLSNKLMILEGYVTLMQLDKKHINPDTIQNLANILTNATDILIHFKLSEEYDSLSIHNKNE